MSDLGQGIRPICALLDTSPLRSRCSLRPFAGIPELRDSLPETGLPRDVADCTDELLAWLQSGVRLISLAREMLRSSETAAHCPALPSPTVSSRSGFDVIRQRIQSVANNSARPFSGLREATRWWKCDDWPRKRLSEVNEGEALLWLTPLHCFLAHSDLNPSQ